MTLFEPLIHTPLAKALGWTLVHSLWEGALAALVLAVLLAAVRSPRLRYAFACVAMASVLAAFAVTFWLRASDGGAGRAIATRPFAPAQRAAAESSPGGPAGFPFDDALPWLAPFWMAGVLIFHVRSLAGWVAARRLRQRGVCRASDPWPLRLEHLRLRLRVSRPVILLETGLADVPVVIGYLKPVILVPAGLLAGMPAAQVEALLLHELAHVRRHDYLVHLLQRVVEGFLFYHPAIWWITRVIRAERENCCDDLAVEASGDARQYAAALTALEETRCAAAAVLAATGGGNLLKRIRRLLGQPEGLALAPLLSSGILTIIVAGTLAAWQAGTPAPPAKAADHAKVSSYKKWLDEDVVYIIETRERTAFLALKTDQERDHFIDQFWLRRDPTPGTPENEFKIEHYRRIAYANKHWTWRAVPGWKTDRGRLYIQYGPPDEIESHPSGMPATAGSQPTDIPTEQWLYRHIEGVGDRVIVEFRDPAKTGDYRMTEDPDPSRASKKVSRP